MFLILTGYSRFCVRLRLFVPLMKAAFARRWESLAWVSQMLRWDCLMPGSSIVNIRD